MMLKHREPVSAFSVYSLKRKSGESSRDAEKLKKRKQGGSSELGIARTSSKKRRQLQKNKKERNGELDTRTNSSFVATTKGKRIQKPLHKRPGKTAQIKEEQVVTVSRGVAKMKQIRNSKQRREVNRRRPKKKIVTVESTYLSSRSKTKGILEDPKQTSRSMFEWLIHPLKVEEFFLNNWEKTPVHLKRSFPNYYKMLMSTPLLDKVLRESHLLFTKNVDITSYENGVRETHNPVGRAVPSIVWDYYLNGCSVRMLNPQTYISKLHSLNATLQEFFGCFVGANSYLTPPNSQGFAPHYDDIEAFILQVEGKKRWRLYKPRNQIEYLPRYSSTNFSQSELGTLILDTIVTAGDLLYFPRGTIHQGETLDDTHSLHITLSVYQRNCWGDFLEQLLPATLTKAIGMDADFRKGLPVDYLNYTGFVHSDTHQAVRGEFKYKVKELLKKLMNYIDVDNAADLMARNHVHDFLPPALSNLEKQCSVTEDGERMTTNGSVENRVEIEPDTKVRLLRSHSIRLIKEEQVFRIYYSTENSKEYHEYDPQFLEVSEEFVPAIKEIILRYPNYIRVEDLPIEGEDNKVQLVKDLWERCLVVTDEPLCVLD